jgi:hypothetical protein
MNESGNPKFDGLQMMPKVQFRVFVFVFGFLLLFCGLLCLMSFFNGAALVS